MKRAGIVLSLVVVLFGGALLVLSCDGGGGGSDVTPPAESLTGTYSLQSLNHFYYDCIGGFAGTDQLIQEFWQIGLISDYDYYTCDWLYEGGISTADFSSYSGTMIVMSDTLHKAYTLSGTSFTEAYAYSITFTGRSSGMIYMSALSAGSMSHEGSFVCEGNLLKLYKYWIYQGGGPFPFPEWDERILGTEEWIKFSDESIE